MGSDVSHRDGHVGQFLPAAAVAVFTSIIGFVAIHAPPEVGEMGVVFAPWMSQSEVMGAIVAAGGRIVDSSRLPNVIIAYAPDAAFQARVQDHGAWFTVAAVGLCSSAGSIS